MRPGTVVKLPDGRVGTVVYHGLDGYGIVWGNKRVNIERILSVQNVTMDTPEDYPHELMPEAMLRRPYPSAGLECVGEDYEVVIRSESLEAK